MLHSHLGMLGISLSHAREWPQAILPTLYSSYTGSLEAVDLYPWTVKYIMGKKHK